MKLTVDAADSKGIVCSYSREDASTTLQALYYVDSPTLGRANPYNACTASDS